MATGKTTPQNRPEDWPIQAGRGTVKTFFLKLGMDYLRKLKDCLRERSLVRGDVTLASGKRSDYYLDCKLTTLHPEGAVLTGHSILALLHREGIRAEAIGGMTMGADPIVSAVVTVSQIEGSPILGFLIRKERKGHGRLKQVEGIEPTSGRRVVIVDEVCTTGKSTIEAIDAAEAAGMQVIAVISLVDREEGGSEILRKRYAYYPICTARELLAAENQTSRDSTEAHASR